MNVNTLTLNSPLFPEILRNIPQPPTILHVAGDSLQDILAGPRVAIVGSRKVSAYGKAVIHQLASDLARAGVSVISGLAIGADTVGHLATLEAGGRTVAVLPAGLDGIYPASNYQLAQRIIRQGGVLISEYPSGSIPYKTNFIARNRLVSGLSDITIVAEAASHSGTLHTARFALEQGKEVMAVPGNITSPNSSGTNNLIKTGASIITDYRDVLHALGITLQPTARITGDTPDQQTIIDLLYAGESDGAALLTHSKLAIQSFNQSLTMLEITGKIRSLGANHWALN